MIAKWAGETEASHERLITMGELRRMSARTIQALSHPTPIKGGSATVALLVPIRKAPREFVSRVLARIDEEAAKRTPEQTAESERILGEGDGMVAAERS
jgi:hypothetical protein